MKARARLFACLLPFVLAFAAAANSTPTTPLQVEIGYLGRAYPEPLPVSLVEPVITDQGVQGARLGVSDNLATGRFLSQSYRLDEKITPKDGDVVADAKALLQSTHLLLADLEQDDLLRLADLPEAHDAIIINVRTSDDDLRGVNCRRNVFHVAPSWAMRADALAQYMAWKRWNTWFLLRGASKEDIDYANAMKRAAKKFGSTIAEERTITFDPGNRRSETGHQQIQAQIPMLTQSPPPHDIVFAADTDDTFGEYLLWRTLVPKPVAGTHGLVAVAWHRSYEQYGGIQLQNRFLAMAKRQMTERDYMAWLAARVFGEAVTRSGKADISSLRAYLLSKDFQVAGFKGQGMSFRTWDRQLRQPIILTGPRSLVSMSPQEGFLHQKHLTDTLGVDAPETACKLPG
ncbi:ABC transporter substrate-binding protein [Hyphomicrobium sp. 2TAF46]|uniref:ABC transporter substrate-binding protein n=1 Tax=Hyphomicrobium sp. 2TAF46 TaxID=3233019 RepID=UPI003F90B816